MKAETNLFNMDAKSRAESIRSLISVEDSISKEEYEEYRVNTKKVFIASTLGLKELYDKMPEEEFNQNLMNSLKDMLEKKAFGGMTGVIVLSGILMAKFPEKSMQELIDIHESLQNSAKELMENTNSDEKISECLEKMKEAVEV